MPKSRHARVRCKLSHSPNSVGIPGGTKVGTFRTDSHESPTLHLCDLQESHSVPSVFPPSPIAESHPPLYRGGTTGLLGSQAVLIHKLRSGEVDVILLRG